MKRITSTVTYIIYVRSENGSPNENYVFARVAALKSRAPTVDMCGTRRVGLTRFQIAENVEERL